MRFRSTARIQREAISTATSTLALSRGLYGRAGITAAPKCADRSSYVRLSSGSYLLALVTPTRGLSGTQISVVPPKYSKARTWHPTHVGRSWCSTGSAYVRLEAPSTARKSTTFWHSPVSGCTRSRPLPAELDDDAALERLLFPDEGHPVSNRPEPAWIYIHRELQRRHVTKQLLWQEYKEATPNGLQYSQFCDRYLLWARPLSATMRQAHHAGEKTFIDFSGSGLDVVHPLTGDCQQAVLFLAVLGASNLTYAEPVLHQDLPTWIGCHVRAFAYFGGTTEIWVPDNPRVGVTKASKYEPLLNRTYEDLSAHYGAAVIPARPYKPRDKAKVEVNVLIASRWILAVLRNRTFYSLEELRAAVAELLEKLNHLVVVGADLCPDRRQTRGKRTEIHHASSTQGPPERAGTAPPLESRPEVQARIAPLRRRLQGRVAPRHERGPASGSLSTARVCPAPRRTAARTPPAARRESPCPSARTSRRAPPQAAGRRSRTPTRA